MMAPKRHKGESTLQYWSRVFVTTQDRSSFRRHSPELEALIVRCEARRTRLEEQHTATIYELNRAA